MVHPKSVLQLQTGAFKTRPTSRFCFRVRARVSFVAAANRKLDTQATQNELEYESEGEKALLPSLIKAPLFYP